LERDLAVGLNPKSVQTLRTDLRSPSDHLPSGLGPICPHGSSWRAGSIPAGDTRECGVVAFFALVDLLAWQDEAGVSPPSSPGLVDRITQAVLKRLLMVQDEGGRNKQFNNPLAEMMGGTVAEIPSTYRRLSPIYHVGAHRSPALLLQGSDDVFGLALGVQRLHECLCAAGVPSAPLELPHTEHGLDLLLAHVSPTTRAATSGVEHSLHGWDEEWNVGEEIQVRDRGVYRIIRRGV
jgi:acetyl esterase/lipase